MDPPRKHTMQFSDIAVVNHSQPKKPCWTCRRCLSETYTVDPEAGDRICMECGIVDSDNIDHNITGIPFSEMDHREFRSSVSCGYKRSSYLRDWLARVTASNEHSLPDTVISTVLCEIERHGIQRGSMTPQQIRHILRHVGLARYYVHSVAIAHIANGTAAPAVDIECLDRIVNMFNFMQPAFEKHKPQGRKNALSYAYVIHQLCRIVGSPELSNNLVLLRSSEKLIEQDLAWKKICKECNWPFHPTI
jgi:Poxvirus Late Transcription Factor VLTF3 like/TFIIB zinc-binding